MNPPNDFDGSLVTVSGPSNQNLCRSIPDVDLRQACESEQELETLLSDKVF